MKKYSKLICAMLVLAMALGLAACGGSSAPAATPAPAASEAPAAEAPAPEAEPVAEEEPAFTTVTPGKLTVATSPDFAPYEFYAVVDGTRSLQVSMSRWPSMLPTISALSLRLSRWILTVS